MGDEETTPPVQVDETRTLATDESGAAAETDTEGAPSAESEDETTDEEATPEDAE